MLDIARHRVEHLRARLDSGFASLDSATGVHRLFRDLRLVFSATRGTVDEVVALPPGGGPCPSHGPPLSDYFLAVLTLNLSFLPAVFVPPGVVT